MEREQKIQREQPKQEGKRKHLLHYLLIYIVCLLVAFTVWLLVRYSMHEESTEGECVRSFAMETLHLTEHEENGMLYG